MTDLQLGFVLGALLMTACALVVGGLLLHLVERALFRDGDERVRQLKQEAARKAEHWHDWP